MTFAELVQGYEDVLTLPRTSPASPLDIQILAGRLAGNRKRRTAGEQSWRRMGWIEKPDVPVS